LLTFQWVFTGAALLVAVAALVRARRLAKRLEHLTESYWELRYEHGQLRARLARVEGEPEAERASSSPSSSATSFVPLSSLKSPAAMPGAERAGGASAVRADAPRK
jgi:hypothetical protein